MKKIIALLLAVFMTLSLCACGGNKANEEKQKNDNKENVEDQNNDATEPKEESIAGFYELVAFMDGDERIEMDSENMSHINPHEISYVIMKDDGTAALFLEFEEYQVTYDGSKFTDEEGVAVNYEFKDGQLVVYYEEGTTYYYEKSDKTGPSDGVDKGGEAFTEDAIESFEGDWHGWCELNYGTGVFEDAEGMTFEIIARFAFDEDGNCQPYFAIAVEDQSDNFQNVTVSYDSYGDYLYFYGELFGTDIDEGSLMPMGDGFLSGNLVLDEGDDYASISFGMRQIGDTWDSDYDYPYMPDEVQDYYAGMDLYDIADLYGVDLDLIP